MSSLQEVKNHMPHPLHHASVFSVSEFLSSVQFVSGLVPSPLREEISFFTLLCFFFFFSLGNDFVLLVQSTHQHMKHRSQNSRNNGVIRVPRTATRALCRQTKTFLCNMEWVVVEYAVPSCFDPSYGFRICTICSLYDQQTSASPHKRSLQHGQTIQGAEEAETLAEHIQDWQISCSLFANLYK